MTTTAQQKLDTYAVLSAAVYDDVRNQATQIALPVGWNIAKDLSGSDLTMSNAQGKFGRLGGFHNAYVGVHQKPRCVKNYFWIIFFLLTLIKPAWAEPNKLSVIENKDLCVTVARLVKTGKAFKLQPKYADNPPRGNDYIDIDIDKDGVADKVKTGCGTGECLLQVELSSGGEFDLNEESFYLIRYKLQIYALISEAEDKKLRYQKGYNGLRLRRLYLIASEGPKLVCGQ